MVDYGPRLRAPARPGARQLLSTNVETVLVLVSPPLKGVTVKLSILSAGLIGAFSLAGCDRRFAPPAPVAVAVPVAVPGPAGPAGVNGPRGATGAQGLSGSQGATGSQGFEGTQGAKGESGMPGDDGVKGDTGKAGGGSTVVLVPVPVETP